MGDEDPKNMRPYAELNTGMSEEAQAILIAAAFFAAMFVAVGYYLSKQHQKQIAACESAGGTLVRTSNGGPVCAIITKVPS